MHKVRTAEKKDINELIELLRVHMNKALSSEWRGSASAYERDGFGKEFGSVIAETLNGAIIGFGPWRHFYDIHHCISGGELMDIYVKPKYRGHGVALSIVACIAKQLQAKGGQFYEVRHFRIRKLNIFTIAWQ